MLVRAKGAGFFVKLRAVGERFVLPDGRSLGSWMEPVKAKEETPEPPAPEPPKAEAPEPEEQPKRRGRPKKNPDPA